MILDEICENKRLEVETARTTRPIKELEDRIATLPPPRDFRLALREEGISLIAEIKRASPSKGVLLEDADPVALGALYEQGGARAISILTDQKYFQGSLDDFMVVKQHVAVPCLRKEFIIDPYQIYESRAAEADAILLIVRILSDQQLSEYLSIAGSLGMAALVETHDAADIERALKAEAHIIGINNRDLSTFETNVNTTMELKKLVPGGNVLVSESGIQTRDQVRLLEDGGVDAILIGEALVSNENIAAKVYQFLHDDQS